MARTALIESLRSQASRDAQALWDAARAEARRRQGELDEALAQERRRLDDTLAAAPAAPAPAAAPAPTSPKTVATKEQ